jgi:TctA family transporter
MSQGDMGIFLTRPITAVILLLAVVAAVSAIRRQMQPDGARP